LEITLKGTEFGEDRELLSVYMTYMLTAIGLSPGGRSTVHIYTQTVNRTTTTTTTTTTTINKRKTN